MSFQPIVPAPGYAGWAFLSRTLPEQQAQFASSPAFARDTAHFRAEIGAVTRVEDLLSDFRMLRVALGAFGLQDDLPNRAFIRRVLEDGVTASDALANRLTDKRYRAFSEAFGFGGAGPPKTGQPGFAERILARFERQEFERAVGAQDNTMRLALSAARALPELANAGSSDQAAWLTVMGDPPLRRVFETAFGLPESFGALPLDQQIATFRDGALRRLGQSAVAQFADPAQVDRLMQHFMARAQIAEGGGGQSPAAIALTLLQTSSA